MCFNKEFIKSAYLSVCVVFRSMNRVFGYHFLFKITLPLRTQIK